MSKRWQLTIASDLHNLPFIAQFVRDTGRAAGLNDDALFAIELACDEACNNVIEHAYRHTDGPLHLTCSVRQADFVIEIQDQGRPFDPTIVLPPKRLRRPADRPVGGLGIHLMRQLMDVVEYRFSPESGNHLMMVKRNVVPLSAPGET